MIRLTESRFEKLAKIEEFDSSYIQKAKEDWIEDPIYVWGGKDEKEAMAYLREKGYKWNESTELDKFSPGWTWGYPAIIFLEKGNFLSYTPVEYGRDTDEEPSLD